VWDNRGYQTSSGLTGIRSLLINQEGRITIGCHDISEVNESIVRDTEVKKATRTRDYLLRPGFVPKIVESHKRKWCSPEIQYHDMKLLYDKLVKMDKPNPDRDELSALMHAWSKVVVPTCILDHAQAYEVEIGDIIYLDYVTTDEYQIKRLTNVIDQLGGVLEPPEWQHTWYHCPREKVVSDGVTRYSLSILEGNYASLSFEYVRFLEAEVASIWLLKHIIGVSKDYHIPLDLIRLVTGVGHYANTAIQRPKSFGATKVFFYQGVMPKVPEDINDQSWGYWSLNDDFLAPTPTFDELKSTENFDAPYFRISPSFETIGLSAIEAEFLQRVILSPEDIA
jgi:hypothetical protein